VDPKGTKILLGVTVYFTVSPLQPMVDFRVGPSAVRKAGIGFKIDDRDEPFHPGDLQAVPVLPRVDFDAECVTTSRGRTSG